MKSTERSNIGFNHIRQGGYGNWRNVFTVQQNELFDTVSRNYNLKFNLSFLTSF